jgi:hypothetical protein
MLAEVVREVLDNHGWSLRAAQEYTDVHANTVDRMTRGLNVNVESVIDWAIAVARREQKDEADEVRRYLRIIGKEHLIPVLTPDKRNSSEITHETDPDYLPVPEGYRGLDDDGREFVNDTVQVAIETALRRQRKRNSIGFGDRSVRGRKNDHTQASPDAEE